MQARALSDQSRCCYLVMTFKKSSLIAWFLLALLYVSPALGQNEGRTAPRRVSPSARISWSAQTGVSKFRLQVARDQGFSDMVIDRVVKGNGYLISGLSEGNYYWRVMGIGSGGGYSGARLVRLTKPKPQDTTETASARKLNKPTETANRSKTPPKPAGTGRPTRTATPTPKIEPPRAIVVKPPANQRQTARTVPTPLPTPRATPLPAASLATLPNNGGWRTVTGNISNPVAAHLRSTTTFDLLGVNSNGTVYALDGATGAALWTTRLGLSASVGAEAPAFTPIVFNGRDGLADVVIAFDGGVRAVDGTSGSELWRTNLPSGALGGVATETIGQPSPTIFVVSASGQDLLLLNPNDGAITGRSAMLARPFGPPVAFTVRNARSMVIVFQGGFVELRNMSGEVVRTVKLANPTTPPVFVAGPRGGLILIGTQTGLMALDASDLRAMGRVAIEDDFPRGRLSVDDLDGDGAPEVVMITNRARVVAMNTTDGKIRWEASGATDAASAAFADVNGDNVLDVLVAAWPAFAIALSGRDGSLLWRAEEEMDPAARMPFGLGRSLVTAAVSGGSNAIVAGTDSYRRAFRAVGLPRGSVRAKGKELGAKR